RQQEANADPQGNARPGNQANRGQLDMCFSHDGLLFFKNHNKSEPGSTKIQNCKQRTVHEAKLSYADLAVRPGAGRRNYHCLNCSEMSIKLMLICRRVARPEEKMSKTVNRAVVVSITSRRRRFD